MQQNLHFSRLTFQDINKNDFFLGPWCSDIEFFYSNKNKFFLKDVKHAFTNIKESITTLDDSYNSFIDIFPTLMNKYHNSNYSKLFWDVLIKDWFYLISSHFHYLYIILHQINNDNISCSIDESCYPFNKIGDLYQFKTNEFLINCVYHSISSFIIKSSKKLNIKYKENKLNIDELKDFSTWSVRGKKAEKKSYIQKFKKYIYKKIVSNNSGSILAYGPISLNLHKKFVYSFSRREFDFKFKEQITNLSNISNRDRDWFSQLISFEKESEFNQLLFKFILMYLPVTLLEDFKRLIKYSSDHIDKKLVVATMDNYIDEELFELALSKEKDSKIIFIQNSGGLFTKTDPTYKQINKFDYIFTFYEIDSKKPPSIANIDNASLISLPIYDKRYNFNIHKKKSNYVLYMPNAMGLFVRYNMTRNHGIKYIEDISKFFYEIHNKDLNIFNDILLKFHNSASALTDDEKLLQFLKTPYSKYNGNIHNEVNIKICNYIIVDYMGSTFFEAILYNTPMILILDVAQIEFTENFVEIFNLLEKNGFLFRTHLEAVEFITSNHNHIYELWNSNEIQNMRLDIVSKIACRSDNWEDILLNKIEELI